MMSDANLISLVKLASSLERSSNHSVELFRDQCNQIRDIFYPECEIDTMNGTDLNVFSNHPRSESRIDGFVEQVWIHYMCQAIGCVPKHKSVVFFEKRAFDLLLEPTPYPSRVLLPLFPYRTIKYSIYIRQPDKRVRLFAFYYIFSPTLWIVLFGSLGLITLVTLLIRSTSSSFSPLQEALQSLYNLFANNGSTDSFYALWSSRIVFIVGSTLVLIFWISFSTFLIAELAVSAPDRLHGDLQLLLTGGKLNAICVEPNSAVHAHLLSKVPSLINSDPCPTTWPMWTSLFKEVCNSKTSQVAFVESSSFPYEYNFFHRHKPLPCELFSIMDNVFQLPKAIIVRRGFPHRKEIGKIFFKGAERGIAHLVTRQIFQAIVRRATKDEIIQEGYLKLTASHLAITFAVLGAGAGAAGIIFIIELAAPIRQQRH